MEPLQLGVLAALTPSDVEIRFYDDRVERIPFDEPTDLVAMSVETYTARRAYQIAAEYRQRGVPVVMGGFHATLCPDEVMRYADSIVIGEAGWATYTEGNLHVPRGGDERKQQRYYEELTGWARENGITVFFFEAFDEAWKVGAEGDVGAYWGLWDSEGKFKYE